LARGEAICALTENDPALWIFAERRDVVMHPVQRCYLVEQAIIAGGVVPGFFREFWMNEEAEDSQPVVHGDHDHALLRQISAILPRFRRGACNESSTVDPNHYRQLRTRRLCGNPYIQGQAIFAAGGIAKSHVAENIALQAVRAEVCGLADAGPFRGSHRRLPAQIADWRHGVRNSKERSDRTVLLALDHSRLGFHLWSRRGEKSQWHDKHRGKNQ
jgi:hypothetical protein